MARHRTLSVGLAAVLTAVATLALAACSDDLVPPQPLPSSAFPQDTGSLPSPPTTAPTGGTGETPTGPTGPASGPTGIPPTISPGPGTGTLVAGQAAVSVAGDVQATKALASLVSSVYSPPPGGMAIVWTAGGTDATTFGLGGLSFTGSQPTAPTLSLTLTVQTEGRISSFVSTAGECTVTIGVFTCSGLVGSGGEVVDVSGSFAAQG
jgi:hypothetical protein